MLRWNSSGAALARIVISAIRMMACAGTAAISMLTRIRSGMRLLLIVSAGASTAVSISAQAEVVTLVRDYTYNASENDSKVSARKAALRQLQALLIEEVGVEVQSSFDQSERLEGDAFSRTVEANYQSFARALTKTRILEERWNGETFYLKAEVDVDPDGLTRQLAAVIRPAAKPGVNPCEALQQQVSEVLKRVPSPQRNQQLVELARAAPIDSDCHQWQYWVLNTLKGSRFPAPEYRRWLFAQFDDTPAHELPSLLPKAIAFVFNDRHLPAALSDQEWQQLQQAGQRLAPDRVHVVLNALSSYSERLPEHNPDSPAATRPLQSGALLKQQLQQWLQAAEAGRLTLDATQLQPRILKSLSSRQPQLMVDWFNRYQAQLTEPQMMAKPLTRYYQDLLKRDLLKTATQPYITAVDAALQQLLLLLERAQNTAAAGIDRNTASTLFSFIEVQNRDYEDSAEVRQRLQRLIKPYPQLWAEVIDSARTSEVNKNLWSIRYQLPGRDVCSPEQCAEALLRETNNQRLDQYGQYLVAYGKRAVTAEKWVIRKLERLQLQRSGPYRTTLKRHMIRVLANIGSDNATALSLLIKSLADFDHRIPEEAALALQALGSPAFAAMQRQFNQQAPLVQRRMVKAMAAMGSSVAEPASVIRFLKSIDIKDDYMRFAVEDALMALSD